MDKDKIIDGLKMTMELCVFDPSTGEEIEPHLLNDINRATYDACKGALEILERLDTDSDMISRQAAIDALRYAQHRFTVADEAGGMGTVKWSEDVIYFAAAERVLTELPPAQPEHDENDLDFVQTHKRIPVQLVVSSDCISRQAAIEALKQQAETMSEWSNRYAEQRKGILTAVNIVEDLPPAQPERIKGHWIESNGLNILMKKFIEKGETWRVCDKCGAGFMIGYQYECDKLYHETFHNFCPKCGAEMEVTE